MQGNNKCRTIDDVLFVWLFLFFSLRVAGIWMGQDQNWMMEVFVSVLDFVLNSGFIDAF